MLRGRRSPWPAFLGFLLVVLVSWAARAEAILVVRPDAGDAMLTETFGRLCGELRMYGFTLRLAEREDGVAGNEDVVGGVSLFRAPGQANARIWIADSSTGKRSLGITVSIDDAEAPSLLAIRAADLLRASLRDFERVDRQERKAPAIPETETASAVVTVRQPGRWAFHAGMGALWETSDLGLGWSAHGGASWWFTSRLALGLEIVVPVTAQSYSVSLANAHLRGYLGLATLRWRAWAGPRLSLDLVQGLGADYLAVRGEAQSPWAGQSSATWTAASSTGACLGLALSQHTGLILSLAAVFLLPRPTLEVADVSYTIRQPLLVTSAGFRYAF